MSLKIVDTKKYKIKYIYGESHYSNMEKSMVSPKCSKKLM